MWLTKILHLSERIARAVGREKAKRSLGNEKGNVATLLPGATFAVNDPSPTGSPNTSSIFNVMDDSCFRNIFDNF